MGMSSILATMKRNSEKAEKSTRDMKNEKKDIRKKSKKKPHNRYVQ